MKIVFVNRFFHPDLAPTGRLASDIAFDLAAAGYDVHTVTSRLSYDGSGPGYVPHEDSHGVHIRRVWTTRFGRGSLMGRAIDYLSFYVSAFLALVWLLQRDDVVIAKTDPPLLSVCVGLAAMLKRARLVNWLQDVFPEAASRSGLAWAAGPVGWLAARLRNWSLLRADVNVALGTCMAAELARKAPQALVRVIPNWADGDLIRPRAPRESWSRHEWGFEGKFVVGYSGNLGRVHDVDTLLDAARLLAAEPAIVFSIVGGGHGYERVKEARLENILQRAYVPEEHLADSLAACNVHLVTLRPALEGLVVPSKFYAVAAAGRAVIFVGEPEGEIAGEIRRHDCGIVVRAGDAAALAEAILRLRDDSALRQAMSTRARAAFEAGYSKPVALERWRGLIKTLAARP